MGVQVITATGQQQSASGSNVVIHEMSTLSYFASFDFTVVKLPPKYILRQGMKSLTYLTTHTLKSFIRLQHMTQTKVRIVGIPNIIKRDNILL